MAAGALTLTRGFARGTPVQRATTSPDEERRKDVWDLAVFGLSRRLGFTAISQAWLRETAKRWAAEEPPQHRGRQAAKVPRDVVGVAGQLSVCLRETRPDHGEDPAALSLRDKSSPSPTGWLITSGPARSVPTCGCRPAATLGTDAGRNARHRRRRGRGPPDRDGPPGAGPWHCHCSCTSGSPRCCPGSARLTSSISPRLSKPAGSPRSSARPIRCTRRPTPCRQARTGPQRPRRRGVAGGRHVSGHQDGPTVAFDFEASCLVGPDRVEVGEVIGVSHGPGSGLASRLPQSVIAKNVSENSDGVSFPDA